LDSLIAKYIAEVLEQRLLSLIILCGRGLDFSRCPDVGPLLLGHELAALRAAGLADASRLLTVLDERRVQ
jgi:hypothetical protein